MLTSSVDVVPDDAGVGPAIIRVTFPQPPRDDDYEAAPDGSVVTSIWENAKSIASNAQDVMRISIGQDPPVAPFAVINTSYPMLVKEKYVVNFSLTGVPDNTDKNFVACARVFGQANASADGSGKFDTAGSQVSYQVIDGDGTLATGNIVPGTVEYKALSDPENEAFTKVTNGA